MLCAFCGQPRKITNEHVWPQWLGRFVGIPPGTAAKIEIKHRDEEKAKAWAALELDIQVKMPCGKCNEGWMSRLEIAAQPFLIPMIDSGSASVFDDKAQTIISAWAAKMAMVSEYLRPKRKPKYYKPSERRSLMDTLIPPDDVRIWIGRYCGTLNCHMSLQYLAFPRASDGALVPSHCATFALGQLALQIFSYRSAISESNRFSIRRGPGGMAWEETLLLPLWPPTPSVALIWPPRHILVDETLMLLGDRFVIRGDL